MPHKIQISDPVGFMNNVANLYQNSSRIFMEYVDNSLDDAEILFQSGNNAYPYPIEIDIFIDPEEKKVTFIDNCQGMTRDTLLRIITDVGSSNKKAQPWTNGQFGFGIHSFRACCEKMNVISKTMDMRMPLEIKIDRREEEAPDEREVDRSAFPHNSGTKVILKDFDKDWWIDVHKENIKNEIENHFEDEVLFVDNGKAEIAYVDIFGVIWFVCFRWIPLYMPYNISECLNKKLMRGKKYFATPFGEPLDLKNVKNEKKGRKALESIGFLTSDFEGF